MNSKALLSISSLLYMRSVSRSKVANGTAVDMVRMLMAHSGEPSQALRPSRFALQHPASPIRHHVRELLRDNSGCLVYTVCVNARLSLISRCHAGDAIDAAAANEAADVSEWC